MKIIERNCPLCTSSVFSKMDYNSGNWPVVKCTECRMVYLQKAPDVSELFENLAWDKTTKVEENRQEKELGFIRMISKLIRKRLHIFPRKKVSEIIEKYATPGNVLDVGCGSGGHILKVSGKYTPYGIEISKALAERAANRFRERNGQIINADALNGLQGFDSDLFTGIVMRSFLEHAINPRQILIECKRTLKKNGVALIKVPNYGSLNRIVSGSYWCGFRFPDHVNYFTPSSLSEMVGRSGLSIKRFGIIDKLPTSDNMWMVAIKA